MNSITLHPIDQQDIRDDFVIKNFGTYTFLNSWTRGEIYKHDNHEIIRLGIYSNNSGKACLPKRQAEEPKSGALEPLGTGALIGLVLLIKHSAKRGTYLLCPHGPLILSEYNFFEILSLIQEQLKTIAKEHHASFIRLSPLIPNTPANNLAPKNHNLQLLFAPLHAHAEETNILDLNLSEEDLMKNLRKTTRYMITRAIKEGVTVSRSKDEQDILDLVKLHHKHSQRNNGKLQYGAFSEGFIRSLLQEFGENCQIFRGEFQGETECMVMTIRFGGMTAYYIGASDIRHPKFSPAYLTQWEAILYAKSQGCTTYNFWGVPPDDNPKHPLAGVGLFKRGFGGKDMFFVHAHDIVVDSKKYYLTRLIEKYRAWKRGYYYKRQ